MYTFNAFWCFYLLHHLIWIFFILFHLFFFVFFFLLPLQINSFSHFHAFYYMCAMKCNNLIWQVPTEVLFYSKKYFTNRAWNVMTIGHIVIAGTGTNTGVFVAMVNASVAVLAWIIRTKINLCEYTNEQTNNKNLTYFNWNLLLPLWHVKRHMTDILPLCDTVFLDNPSCTGMKIHQCDQYIGHHLRMDWSHIRCTRNCINHRKNLRKNVKS